MKSAYENMDDKESTRKIICVDMDAFFAAVEIRDNPDLAGKPLIIRNRVKYADARFEKRTRFKFVFQRGFSRSEKFRGALPSERGVVSTYSYEARKYGVRSAMSIKEAYRRCPKTIGYEIKRRVKEETGLTCSVGVGYSLMSAKLASEEN